MITDTDEILGHILTRIVHKLAGAHGELKEYQDEIRIYRELLDQKRWRQGKRGYVSHIAVTVDV